MKDTIVIVPVLGMRCKVLNRFRNLTGKEFDMNVSHAGPQNCFQRQRCHTSPVGSAACQLSIVWRRGFIHDIASNFNVMVMILALCSCCFINRIQLRKAKESSLTVRQRNEERIIQPLPRVVKIHGSLTPTSARQLHLLIDFGVPRTQNDGQKAKTVVVGIIFSNNLDHLATGPIHNFDSNQCRDQ